MPKERLANGLNVIYCPKPGLSVVIEVMIKVGSNHEKSDERGISHFLEHMFFEGTRKRPDNRAITNEIERIGGYFNAYTTNERTCIYIKVLKKHFNKAVEILADILLEPAFNEKDIEKEKKIVLREIDLINDEPSYYQWILLQQNLFSKHPCRYPTYGDKKIVQSLTREKVVQYFQRHYNLNNMTVAIVGDVPHWRKELKENFTFSSGQKSPQIKCLEPPLASNKVKKVKKKVINTYVVFGFRTVPRTNSDIYALEVINAILGRGQSGKIFTELRSKRGLAYDVGTQNVSESSFGYFAVYANIKKKNLEAVRKLILEELRNLQTIDENDLKEAKDYIEGNYLLEMEDNQKMADQILAWEQVKDVKLMDEYLAKIKKVKINDVKKIAKKYFKHYTLAILEGQ